MNHDYHDDCEMVMIRKNNDDDDDNDHKCWLQKWDARET